MMANNIDNWDTVLHAAFDYYFARAYGDIEAMAKYRARLEQLAGEDKVRNLLDNSAECDMMSV